MTTLTMRHIKGHFVVTGPDIEPVRFNSRLEARDWCETHYPGSPITEVGASRRAVAKTKATLTLSPDDPLAKAHESTARIKR